MQGQRSHSSGPSPPVMAQGLSDSWLSDVSSGLAGALGGLGSFSSLIDSISTQAHGLRSTWRSNLPGAAPQGLTEQCFLQQTPQLPNPTFSLAV
ncbi:hypothetical protein DPEC_G00076620 [Dallia pectoralis]|uniref:Uncharacterized protein n=1 Tax=Dallia pectoralis TaxID=75939 RepID=A0ACC2H480_DALPE|nr:hypothetical protein DPEC_G00076620 [Dallia pectoralis]